MLAVVPGWVYIVLASVVVISGTLVAMLMLVTVLGGWRALAREYGEDLRSVAEGRTWRFQSISLRKWCGYNGCAVVTAADSGLRLAVWWIFRPGHPPLWLPYEEMELEEISTFGIKRIRVRMARVSQITIDIAPVVFEHVTEVHGDVLPGDGNPHGNPHDKLDGHSDDNRDDHVAVTD